MTWEYVKEFYKTNFGIEGWVVELYANIDVLSLCASGASNTTISSLCQMDLDDVVEILMNTYKFSGWTYDLPIDPYKLFLECEQLGNLAEGKFISEITYALRHTKDSQRGDMIYRAYWTCRTLKEIEERIADEWI